MKQRRVDETVQLVPYYPNYRTALAWYQDLELCKQVDNRDEVYDLDLLKRMYRYLDAHGDLFYIKYKNRLCGDVCLQSGGEVNIVIAKPFQNKHIGRRVICEIIQLAREKGIPELHAEIYSFNTQSQTMFQSVGFVQTGEEQYTFLAGNPDAQGIERMEGRGEQNMKIAVTYEDGQIFQHFGHTAQFKVYEVEDGKVRSAQVVGTGGSGHGALAGFLMEQGVTTLICGGIGSGAQAALANAGITLYGGVSGSADKAVAALLSNELSYNPDVHCNHHDHQGGHNCGHHE